MADAEKIFGKTYNCPVCGNSFKNLTVRQGRARMDSTDIDLKVNYKDIEPLKYDIIQCPRCGYASIERYYERITAFQRKDILEEVSKKHKQIFEEKEEYTFDEALERYKSAFLTARVKNAHNSEMGLLCLKNGWLFRSYANSLGEGEESKAKELRLRENAFLGNALNYLTKARATEQSPICGMDDVTLDCLLAGLCTELGKYDEAKRYMSNVLQNRSATKNVKDKILNMKEFMEEHVKEEAVSAV
ncbi:MAG: DUF2225 domain-containing protein [Lachnospiraceae bacterium]|nr:DUF2225 domain-containing protein [Lachnospiraceae bacterium]